MQANIASAPNTNTKKFAKLGFIQIMIFPKYVKVGILRRLGCTNKEINNTLQTNDSNTILENCFNRYHSTEHCYQGLYQNLDKIIAIRSADAPLFHKITELENIDKDYFKTKVIANILSVTTTTIKDTRATERQNIKDDATRKELEGYRGTIDRIRVQFPDHTYQQVEALHKLGIPLPCLSMEFGTGKHNITKMIARAIKNRKDEKEQSITALHGEVEKICATTTLSRREKIFQIRNLNPKVFTFYQVGKVLGITSDVAGVEYRAEKLKQAGGIKTRVAKKKKPAQTDFWGNGHFNPIFDTRK